MFEGIAKWFGANLLRTGSTEVFDAIVRQVAEQSVAGVSEQVAAHVDAMSLSEARGYVRARAARIVRRQARLAISRHPDASEDLMGSVVRAATERLVPAVLRQTSVGVPRRFELPLAA